MDKSFPHQCAEKAKSHYILPRRMVEGSNE